MQGSTGSPLKKGLACFGMTAVLCLSGVQAKAADIDYGAPILNPTPVANQMPAVDGINFKMSAVTGVVGGYSNHMFIA